VAGILESADTAQRSGLGQVHLLCQLDVAHPAVALQGAQDLTINLVHTQ
jgi:hypothetical protein